MKISFGSSPVVSKTSNSSPKSQNNCDQIPCTSALMNCKMIKTSSSIYIKEKNSSTILGPFMIISLIIKYIIWDIK